MKRVPHNKTHGLTGGHFYRKYIGAYTHCNNPKATDYRFYGGRGIKLLWPSFTSFMEDMYPSYLEHVKKFGEKQTTIDRIDPLGDYCKENCRWATRVEQNRNRRDNLLLTFRGKTQVLTAWAEELGFDEATIRRRIKVQKLSVEEALTRPLGVTSKNHVHI